MEKTFKISIIDVKISADMPAIKVSKHSKVNGES